MSFTYEVLNKLDLEKTEWVMIKHKGYDDYDSGQIATNQQWGSDKMPIFDDDEKHIYIHFVRQSHPSKLEIENLEYFYRGKNHPWYVIQMGHVRYTFGKFHTLTHGLYTMVKTNGDQENILFIENKLEPDGDKLIFKLYYKNKGSEELKSISYYDVVDVS